MEALFIYCFDERCPDEEPSLFGTEKLMVGYSFELASIEDITKEVSQNSSWGDMIIVREGVFFYNTFYKTYTKIEELIKTEKR